MPTRPSPARGAAPTPSPIWIWPRTGCSRPAMRRRRVLFPQPFGPMTTVRLPAGISRVRSRSASSGPAAEGNPTATSSRRRGSPAGIGARLVCILGPTVIGFSRYAWHRARGPAADRLVARLPPARRRAIGLIDASENASRSPSPIRTVTVGPVCRRALRSLVQVGPIRFAPSAAPRRPGPMGFAGWLASASRPPVGTFTPPRRR